MKVIIYTTPACVYCGMAKRYFERYGIEYEELDVAEDQKARKEMQEKSHQLGVPVIEIDGDIFAGFDRAIIAKALGIKG